MTIEAYARTDFALDILELRENRILVREDRIDAELLPSGLYAPEVASGPGHYRLATVVACGPGLRKTTTDERLKRYVRHLPACDSYDIYSGVGDLAPCSCGLDKILSGDYDPLDVRPGDRVMMGRSYSGEQVVMDGAVHILCREDDVVGRLVPARMNQPLVDLTLGLTIQPLADRVLVEMVPQEIAVTATVAPRGIELAQSVEVQFVLGKVVAHGDGWGLRNGRRAPMTVQDGDIVLFRGDTGQATRIGGKTFWMMRENEIGGIADMNGRM